MSIAFDLHLELCPAKQEIRNAICEIAARNFYLTKKKDDFASMVSLPGNAWLTESTFFNELSKLSKTHPEVVFTQ